MTRLNSRYDPFDRINARLKAAVEAERYTVTCKACLSKYDTRSFAGCPYCASSAHKKARGES